MDGSWSSLDWPGVRYGHTAVGDSAHDQVLVFGGYDGAYHNDVWVLMLTDPPRWTYVRPGGTAPVPRYTHSAIFDPVRDRMILFAGDDGGLLGDLWDLSLSGAPAWSAIAAVGAAPAARHRHTAIYDPLRERMIVFGGRGDGTLLDDVWALSLSAAPAWTRIFPTGAGPAPRYRHSAIYDPVRDRMIVFGGRNDGTTFGDVWALSLDGPLAWSEIAAGGTAPKPRGSHVAVYDPAGDRMLVYGGEGATRNDAWSLSLAGPPAWSRLQPTGSSPIGHASHAAALDARRGRLVTFGGLTDAGLPAQELSFLALAEPPAWSSVVQPLAPPMGAWHSAVYDPAGKRLIVFGGMIEQAPNPSNEAWALALEPDVTWARIDPSGTPPVPRKGHAAIYDPVRRSMVGFGGFGGPGGVFEPVLDDVWSLSTSESPPAWRSYASFDPPSRSYSTPKAFYDPIRDRMIVYMSGFSDGMPTPTVYTQSLSENLGHWTRLVTSGTAPPRAEDPSVIYDPLRDRMIVFGGSEAPPSYVLLNDVWALSLVTQTWSKLSPSGTPPEPRYRHTAVYDPIRDRMVMLGGKLLSGESNETWELSLADPPAWRRLSFRAPLPPPLTRAAAVVVPGRDWILMQGGYYGSWAENGTWILEGGMPAAPACHCPEDRGWGASRSVSLRYAVSHPLPGERRLDWTLRSARDWPGFPMHGTVVVGAASGDSVAVVIAVPDSAAGGRNRLTFETTFSGAGPDLVTCVHDLFDATPKTLGTPSDVPRSPGLALHGIRPNPSRGEVAVAFSLPASGGATLELYDVAGRRVSRRELELGEGSHVMTVSPGTRLAPGVFIVRLEFGGQARYARGVRVR